MGAANMVLKMENVERRGDTYYVRLVIPRDVRAAFSGKTAEWKPYRLFAFSATGIGIVGARFEPLILRFRGGTGRTSGVSSGMRFSSLGDAISK
jgi:hypothetical protein